MKNLMDLEIVLIKMKKETKEEIKYIQKIVNSPSKSDAVRRAVQITAMLMDAASRGEKVIIEEKSGKRTQIMFHGLDNE